MRKIIMIDIKLNDNGLKINIDKHNIDDLDKNIFVIIYSLIELYSKQYNISKKESLDYLYKKLFISINKEV